MKIVIVGDGKVGGYAAKQLAAEGHDVTIIDHSDTAIQRTGEDLDILCIQGNGAIASVQKEAGVDSCDLLIAATGSDELNMLCCLVAKKLGAKHTIARVRTPDYYEEMRFIADDLRLSFAINPDLICSNDIARTLRIPNAIKVDVFAKGRVELLQFQLPENCILEGRTLMELPKLIRANVLICAVQRGDTVTTPSGGFRLEAGDTISFVASRKDAREFFKQLHLLTRPVHSVMVVGGGRLGYYLSKQLVDSGFNVKILDKNLERCEELSHLIPGATVLCGDGTDEGFLREAGLEMTDAFVAVTGVDEQNVLASMFVRKTMPDKKVITKVNRNTFRHLFESLDLGSVFDTNVSSSNLLVRYARSLQNTVGSKVETMYQLVEGKVEAVEFRVSDSSHIIGKQLMQLNIKDGYLIACINRGGIISFPNGASIINPGDTVVVVTTNPGLSDLDSILSEANA